jgi:hypothetical protein
LGQTAQDGLCLGSDGQHRLQQEAMSFPMADRSQARHTGMPGQIDFRCVLHQQDHHFCLQPGVGLLPMRLHQCLKGHFRFITQSVHRFQRFPGLVLFGQRSCWIAGHRTSSLDCPPGAPPIPQGCLPKRLLGPLVRRQQLVCFHQLPRFASILAKMWVKDSTLGMGSMS